MIETQAVVVAVLALVHLLSEKLRFLDVIPRSRWLSMAGGISVAYVFIHIFPELAEAQERIGGRPGAVPWIEHHAYLVALLGLAAFYGLETMAKSALRSRSMRPGGSGVGRAGANGKETTTSVGVFWVHVLAFAAYNGLIGYLLVHREGQDVRGLLFFGAAMAMHFLVNDFGLRQHHKEPYHRLGRWVLIAAVVIGWAIGLAVPISRAAIGVFFAFLAGGVVLNVLKEELPEDRQSRFAPFAFGAALYAGLLLFV